MDHPINIAGVPGSYEVLLSTIDRDLRAIEETRQRHASHLLLLATRRQELGEHPHRAAYIFGGIAAIGGLGRGHILALGGFQTLGWEEALARLAGAANEDGETAALANRLRLTCEADAGLEARGLALFAEHGLLKNGAISPFWLKRPKLGLGYPAKLFGLTSAHAHGLRGLYTLPMADLRRGFENEAADRRDALFGELLLPVIDRGGVPLADHGARAIHLDGKARYEEDSRRFAEHQARNPDRGWRSKPARSRQGHLAITTARAKDMPLPAERTRGDAADWLDRAGANARYRKEG